MRIHSRQTGEIRCTDGRKEKAVPAWAPPAYIIPLIDKNKKKEKRSPAQQPVVEIDDDVPVQPPEDKPGLGEGYKDPQKDKTPQDKDEDRGVWEIQF